MMSGLPKRDLWLLPLIVALTSLVLLAGAEGLARLAWPERQADACERIDATGDHFRPNCRSRVKLAEGPWVEYAYNNCGYRSEAGCGPKPAGSLRVAVLGSSISRGFWVSYQQSFAGRLEHTLHDECGRDVEFENLALPRSDSAAGPVWHTMANRVGEALALQPDAIVTVLAPYDLEQYRAPNAATSPGSPAAGSQRLAAIARLKKEFGGSRAVQIAEHFFYLDLRRYVSLYLQHGDQADFLRSPLTPAWQRRLRIADETLGRVANDANRSHVPLIVVFMPSRVEAALSASTTPPAGVHPFLLGQEIAQIAHRHGALFVYLSTLTHRLPTVADHDYYPVDGHPNGYGHGLIAGAVEHALVTEVPAFATCRASAGTAQTYDE